MKKLFLLILLVLNIFAVNSSIQLFKEKNSKHTRFTVLGLGDSITEGGKNFHSYLYDLWEMLYSAGYDFEFIGPHASKCRIGAINNAGYSGKNAEFLEAHIDSIYRLYPADIVLLHSGHNHSEAENPVAGIITSQESIIRIIKIINPNVRILVAQVITSGKLPKYSYLKDLNKGIAKMVKRQKSKNVILVDQAKGFDWQKYTIADKVHPNPEGAKRMACVWFKSLKKILPPASQTYRPELVSYKQVKRGNLYLHVFKPVSSKKGIKHPCIIYFFGGGWATGSPLQFYRECAYYASKGMVAITADYRISSVDQTTPFESVEDARDAIRYIRDHSMQLNLDANKIVAAGASAGGHLAAVTGILSNSIDNKSSYKPNLLVLYYPVIDNSPDGFGTKELKKRYQEISPLHNIDNYVPPTLFILGTKDPLISVSTAETFKSKLKECGVACDLILYKGAGHPIFSYTKPLTSDFYKIRIDTDNFLKKQGYLKK
ncbi:alpha/beta hydrolase fold domain-containing protein [Parabacteroides sp. FAFU027]|uniref:alpha/beta hydrolase fold domain-containing protein n=1 Tax=Parabacteroides sp. FAFU027 TaxID=2922715 RepID=UPI001FAF353D|nr:alpha/beta hydrolase fold domain-containing protein [Parabacteroides sp. FAFU027]